MRLGMMLGYSGGFMQAVEEVAAGEAAGLDLAVVPEAYSFDAVSQLGFVAARTSTIQLMSGIMQLYTRTPSLLAMTAAGLDYVSGGRFWLGLGASGPQVIEGFHGVPYDAPIGRMREVVEICRLVWRREPSVYAGKYYRLPLPDGQGTGLGKPLKMINHPVRPRVPIVIAAIGPRNVALAAEVAEGWQPLFFIPELAGQVWGESLALGSARRGPELGALDVSVSVPFAITDDPEPLLERHRAMLALYIGGMGARGRNFSNDLVRRYGYEREARLIQDLYLSGRRAEAAAAVPSALIRDTALVGPLDHIERRLAAYASAGVTTLLAAPLAPSADERIAALGILRGLTERVAVPQN